MKTATDAAWDELCEAASKAPSAPVAAITARIAAPHPFAKLGPSPYAYAGFKTGSAKCALCGKAITNLYFITSGNAVNHAVGSECVLKLNGFEAHLVGQVKTAKKRFEKQQRAAREAKKAAAECAANLEVSMREHPAECKWITFEYKGNFDFYLSLRQQLQMRGGLSDRQWECITRAMQKASEPKPARTYSLAVGTTLIVTKFFAKIIGRDTGLSHPHFAIEVVEVSAETEKAYKIKGRLSAQRTSHCCVCGLALTNAVSVLAGIGPICADRYEVSTTEELHARLQTEYKAEIELWIPKSQIKERKEKV